MTNTSKLIEGLEHTISETREHIGPLHFLHLTQALGFIKAMQWRPIEEAPRKGLFIARKGGFIHITSWALCHPKDGQASPHTKPDWFIPLSALPAIEEVGT